MTDTTTRFAPSPNGLLHLGHALSALTGFRAARDAGGRFLLRIEDIDLTRARPEFEQAIYDDLAWLGLTWETPVRRQSEHFDDYEAALARLGGLTYPCFCTRKDIEAEIAAVRPRHMVRRARSIPASAATCPTRNGGGGSTRARNMPSGSTWERPWRSPARCAGATG